MRGVQPCTLGHAWRPSRRAGGLEVDIQHHLVHRRVCECEIAEGFAGFTRACEQLSTSGKKYSMAFNKLHAAIGLDLRVRPRPSASVAPTLQNTRFHRSVGFVTGSGLPEMQLA